jgi:hypothetical protein
MVCKRGWRPLYCGTSLMYSSSSLARGKNRSSRILSLIFFLLFCCCYCWHAATAGVDVCAAVAAVASVRGEADLRSSMI